MAHYTLKLSFDLRQVTQSLAYKFVLTDGQKGPIVESYTMEDEGPLAGTFNFQQGDEISIDVIATAPADQDNVVLKDFGVTNCTFVFIPAHMTEFLSLFHETSACASVENWNPIKPLPPTIEDENKNSRRYSISSVHSLPVQTKNGQWQVSGYLSVQLPPLGDVPVLNGTRNQLYFFDPESSSGTGGGFRP